MRTYTISEFKTHALAIIKAIAETGESVLVTKRGKPLARVVPSGSPERRPQPGKLAGTITFEDDIVTPLDFDLWEAGK